MSSSGEDGVDRQRGRRQRRRTLAHFRRLGERLVAEGRGLTPRERSDLERAKIRLGFRRKPSSTIDAGERSPVDPAADPPPATSP